jgi:hypothetical protein
MDRPRVDHRQEPVKDPMPGLKKQLVNEYNDTPEERIDEVAKHALGRFSGVRVTEFVPVLAWRHARHHLRRAS